MFNFLIMYCAIEMFLLRLSLLCSVPRQNEYQFSGWVTTNVNGECSLLPAYKRAYGSSQLTWSKGRQPPGAVLYRLYEPGELLQCFMHAESTTKIIILIIAYLLTYNEQNFIYLFLRIIINS